MGLLEVILMAVGLAMDALAVSVCKGLAGGKAKLRYSLICGLWFGGFQTLMPLIGFALASTFASYVAFVAPWVSFALLAFLGVKMIIEGVRERNDACGDDECTVGRSAYGFSVMLPLAVATSIDALAVGVTFALGGVSYDVTVLSNIWLYVGIIGIISFVISASGNAAGGGLGAAFGVKFKFLASILGGVILCALGVKFLVEGMIDSVTANAAAEALQTVRIYFITKFQC